MAALPAVATAQTPPKLDQRCSVSVLNRTVRVNADGTWVLPNIPANFGRVKARATCIVNGVTRFGESDYFTVPPNGIVTPPQIILGTVSPIPVSLLLTPALITFTAVGQTQQITVTATYPDGSTKDVTGEASGTDYTISNSAIATMNANGLVTAVASGTVVIQAINEGTPGMATAKVVLSTTDTDGDGIPDDVEVSRGMDPRNRVDALEDFDRDNLTNLDEYLTGTDLRNADTDADGLLDGNEVRTHHTNPLIADSDGDLIPDGVEIRTNSNPLNRNSYDLLKATATSTLSPSSFLLTTNPVVHTDVFVQLSWVVTLIDGKTTIDLIADPRTSVSSTSLNICNFGAEAGRVFAGQPGECQIVFANNTLGAVAKGTVKNFVPTAVSFLPIPGYANNLDVKGNYAYVAAGGAGLQIVDVTDRSKPQIAAARALPGNANDVVVAGNFAYVAAGTAGLQIVDVTNPLTPTIVGALAVGATGTVAWDVVVKGNRAYVANGTGGLVIVDVSSPSTPVRLGSIALAGTSKGVDVDTTRMLAVVARGTNGFSVVNVADAAAPALLGEVAGGDVRDVVMSDGFAFLADMARSFTSVDLTTPAVPVIVASTPQVTGGLLNDVALMGQLVAGADVFFVNGVPMIDVSEPSVPTPRVTIDFTRLGDSNGTGIAVDSSFVYMTATHGFDLGENGITGNFTRLYIGQYRSDDQTPPTVAILSPGAGDSTIEGAKLPVTIDASDNFAVASVALLVDHQVVATSTAAPYQLIIDVPVGAASITLTAQASDFAGNVGTSSDVAISIARDTEKPAVQITAPTTPLTVPEGTVIKETVNAVDNVAVTRVEFLLNDMIVATRTAPPYEAFVTLPIGPTSFRFGARAFDPAGNAGVASEAVVNVTSDPPPVVRITSPASDISASEGERITVSVEATDNGAVLSTKLELFIDGVPAGGDLRTLSEYVVRVPIGPSRFTLVASAIDNLGQVGTSQPVVINIIPEPAPEVRIVTPTEDTPVVEGSTITVVVEATDDVGVEAVVLNGFAGDPEPPYEFLLTIPVGNNVRLRVDAIDNVGKTTGVDLQVPTVADPLTTVRGTIIDESNLAVEGADVRVSASGLTAEFFRSSTPLTSIPDLTGATPDIVKLVSTPSFNSIYVDPFGINALVSGSGVDPSTIVRLRGNLKVTNAGPYTFALTAFVEGQLTVNGTRFVALPQGSDNNRYVEGTIDLPEGDVPIEIVGLAVSGSLRLSVQWSISGGTLQGIPADLLTPAYSPYQAVSTSDGSFTIQQVPTALGALTVSATANPASGMVAGHSAPTPPVGGDVTDVGTIQLSPQRRLVSKATGLTWLPGYANDVAGGGNNVYVASGEAGLHVVTTEDVRHPGVHHSVPLPGNANGVFLGPYIYVAGGVAGLHVLNFAPAPFLPPTLAGSVATGGEAWDVVVSDDRAYVANGASGLAVVDVSDGTQPTVIGTLPLAGISKDVAIDEALHVAVVVGSAGVTTVDVLDPSAMHVLGTVAFSGARHVSIKGHIAVVATGTSMVAIDVSTPLTPRVLSDLPGAFSDLSTLAGSDAPKLVVAAGTSEEHVIAPIVDVHVPEFPAVVKTIDFSPLDAVLTSDGASAPTNVTGVSTDGTFIYATVASGAPMENGTTGETYLYIGQYLVPNDPYGSPPTWFFNNIFPNEPIRQVSDSVIEVGISAFDDIALASVKISLNGQLVVNAETPSSRQWFDSFRLSIPVGATSVTLTVETVDVGGNTNSRTNTFEVAPYVPQSGGGASYPLNLGGIGTDGRNVWVTMPDNTDGFGVSKLQDANGNYGFITPAAGHHRSTYITVDGAQNAWVSNVDNGTVVQISPEGGGPLNVVNIVSPGNLLYENGHIWVTSGALNVVKINAATGATMGTFATGGLTPGAMVFDGVNVWVVNKSQNTVSKLRAADGALLGVFATGRNVNGIAFDGTNIWTANRDDGTVSKINPATGATVATVPVGPSPTGVAFDGTYLYVVNFEGTTGSKIRPSDNAILTTFFAPEQATAIVVANKHLFVVSGHTVTEYR